jgi:L-ascorbate metabolism protein UlaG (beta-lactamase superfamily)
MIKASEPRLRDTRRMRMTLRYVGGPTALLEIGGLRVLIDPTFDPPGSYPIGTRSLTKTIGPAVAAAEIEPLDIVLLSHDQHPDNLDHAGRELLLRTPNVFSTPTASERIGAPVVGLEPWQSVDVGALRITAVPARHGPEGCEPLTGPVTGFVLHGVGVPSVYVSGDNAALEHVAAVAAQFPHVEVALLFAGSARTALLDGAPLTLGSAEAAEAARLLPRATVVPLHFEGWAHFSQGRDTLAGAFEEAGVGDRLRLPEPGATITLP